jgi:xanthine dehydrogenase accessory factor
MRRETLQVINRARKDRRAIVRACDLASGEEQLIDPATDSSELGLAAAEAARADRSGVSTVGGRDWFLSVFNSPLDLAIVGAVHIAQPLARMATLAGYGVRIIDPRTAFATTDRFPGVAISHEWPDEALAAAPLGPRSALVALTHDPKVDDLALGAALVSPCFYIGALGSKKTHAARLARLRAQGFTDAQLARIHGPVGLAIGAVSPAEIAVSILAQMTDRLRKTAAQEKSHAAAAG